MSKPNDANYYGFNVASAHERKQTLFETLPVMTSEAAAPSAITSSSDDTVSDLRLQLASKDDELALLRAELAALKGGMVPVSTDPSKADVVSVAHAVADTPAVASSTPLAAAELEISVMMLDSASTMQTSFVLSAVATKFRRMLEAERCSLFLIDEERDELWTTVADGIEVIRIPINSGIVGHSLKIGQVLNVADVYQSPYFNKELDRQSGYRTRSVLCGPIRNPSGQIIGAVQMLNKLPPAPGFSNQDIEILNVFIKYAGNALELTQRHERTQELASLSQRRAQLSVDLLAGDSSAPIIPTLRSSIDLYRRCCRADTCTVFVCSEQARQLIPTSFAQSDIVVSFSSARAGMPARSLSRIDWVFRTGQPLLLPADSMKWIFSASENSDHPSNRGRVPYSYMALPLINAKTGTVIGVMEMRRYALPSSGPTIAPELIARAHAPRNLRRLSSILTGAQNKSLLESDGDSHSRRSRRLSSLAASITAPRSLSMQMPELPESGLPVSESTPVEIVTITNPDGSLQAFQMPESFAVDELTLARALSIHVAHTISYTLSPEQYSVDNLSAVPSEFSGLIEEEVSALDTSTTKLHPANHDTVAPVSEMTAQAGTQPVPIQETEQPVKPESAEHVEHVSFAEPAVAAEPEQATSPLRKRPSLSRRVSFNTEENIAAEVSTVAADAEIVKADEAELKLPVLRHESNASHTPPAINSLVQSLVDQCRVTAKARVCNVWLAFGPNGERSATRTLNANELTAPQLARGKSISFHVNDANSELKLRLMWHSGLANVDDSSTLPAEHLSPSHVHPLVEATDAAYQALRLGVVSSSQTEDEPVCRYFAPIFHIAEHHVPTMDSFALATHKPHGGVMGVVELDYTKLSDDAEVDPEAGPDSMPSLLQLGANIAAALVHSDDHSQALAARVRSEYVLQMLQDVSAEPQTRRLIQRVMRSAKALVGADRCTVFIVDHANQTLWSTVADGADEIRLPIHSGIAGAVAAWGALANIEDVYDDPRFDRTIDAMTGYRTRSMLCVPIRHPIGGVIGVLQVMNKSSGRFTSEDESLVLALSSHIGISLYNAQLYERTLLSHRRSEALMQIIKASSSSSAIAIVMQRMIEATHNMLVADEVVLFLVDSVRGQFYCRVTRLGTEMIRQSIENTDDDSEKTPMLTRSVSVAGVASVEAYTARQGGIVNIRDVRTDKRFTPLSGPTNKTNAPFPVLCASACDREGRPVAVIRASMKRAPAPSSVGAPVGGRDQPAASSGTLTNIDADTAALLDRRVLTTVLSPGNSNASHDHFDFGASTNNESSAAARQTWIPFTNEDEYLLQAMASEIANVLKRRSLEATFHSLVADTENVASDPISKTLLSQYLQNVEAPEIKPADRPATPANTAESAASADDAAEKAARSQAAREAVMMGTIALTPSSNLSAAALNDPNFDVWAYSYNELLSFSVEIFSAFRYFDACGTSLQTLKAFLVAVHNGYNDHHYHNFRHGFGVLHVSYLLLTRGDAIKHLEFLEVAALCIASICHDLNHDGMNNAYYVNSEHELALIYNDNSVLENMHASNTLRILKKKHTNILENLPAAEYKQMRKVIVSAILHTDMADHFDLTTKLRSLVEEGNFAKDNKTHRDILIGALIHSADLSNPLMPRDSAVKWTVAVYKEFNQQAEIEKREGLPVAPFMATTDFFAQAKMNIDFIDYIVSPLWTALSELLKSEELFGHLLGNMRSNRVYWKSVVDEAAAAKEKESGSA